MTLTLEDITPLEDKATPLTNLFASIIVEVRGGRENITRDLAAALHVMRSIELAAQQLDNLSGRLMNNDPALAQLKHRALLPIQSLGHSMEAALKDAPNNATFQDLTATLNPN